MAQEGAQALNDYELFALAVTVQHQTIRWQVESQHYGEPQWDPNTEALASLNRELDRRGIKL
jgi:hypothetical protein